MRDTTEARQTIEAKAANLRKAAEQINKIKAVIRKFDGKVYNCRFDEAIKELTTEDIRFYVSNSYGWFYIKYIPRNQYNMEVSLLTGYSCKSEDYREHQTEDRYKLFDGKRIRAEKMIEELTANRERLLAQAYELTTAADNLETTVYQIRTLQTALNTIIGSLPYEAQQTMKINKYY